MDKTILFILISGIVIVSEASFQLDLVKSRVFDTELYERVIDSSECQRQILHLRTLGLILYARFLDAGVRVPRGVFMLLVTDLGNYNQCLDIYEEVGDMKIEGKYALFTVPLNQTLKLPFINQPILRNEKSMQLSGLKSFTPNFQSFSTDEEEDLIEAEFSILSQINLAACMPKVCSLDDWITNILFDVSTWGIRVDKMFYRLPNDKPWVAADYVAIAIFSTLGLITVLSTLYDINHTVIKKQGMGIIWACLQVANLQVAVKWFTIWFAMGKIISRKGMIIFWLMLSAQTAFGEMNNPKKANIYYRTFSVYTNTSRLLTFNPNPNALDCLDGIRSISMMWVILGHVFQTYTFFTNILEAILFLTSAKAVFISTGLFTVDSFFMMAGLLLVYTTVGKFSGPQLLKRLHAYYLNRLLRMFPLLATLVLLEASVFHRVADGPYWTDVAENTAACRMYWWTTLLHIQNYVNPDNICIKHSWYIAIDIQLHIISPLVLYWVLGKNKKAVWAALIIALLAILTGSTVFNFIMEFPSIAASLVRMQEQTYYLSNYYMNTLCRGSVFFIGMITGYIIHIYKGRELKLNNIFVTIAWTIALGMIAFCFYGSYVIMQLDHNNQVVDSLFNSFMRGIWAIGLSWIIFACIKGYGGPINWFLTLKLWKLPARISFAMYLYHFPILFMYVGAQEQIPKFSGTKRMYDFLAFLTLTFILAFFLTVVIDAPFSTLTKMLMEGGQRRPRVENGNPKPEHLPNQNVSGLQRYTITTLQKDPFIMEKNRNVLEENDFESNGKYLKNTGAPSFERNEALEEKSGPSVDRHEVVRKANEISTVTKDNAALEDNGSV